MPFLREPRLESPGRPDARRRATLRGLLGGLGVTALGGCGFGSGRQMSGPAIPAGSLVPLVRTGSEPPGFDAYTYVLFAYEWNEEKKATDTVISPALIERYGEMLSAVHAMPPPRAAGVPHGPVICVPSRHPADVYTLEDYADAVSLTCLAWVVDAFRRAGQAVALLQRPGPHLVTTTRPLGPWRGDAPLLAIDLTDAHTGSFRPLLLALDDTLRARAAPGRKSLEALRDRLAALAASGRYRIAFVADAVVH